MSVVGIYYYSQPALADEGKAKKENAMCDMSDGQGLLDPQNQEDQAVEKVKEDQAKFPMRAIDQELAVKMLSLAYTNPQDVIAKLPEIEGGFDRDIACVCVSSGQNVLAIALHKDPLNVDSLILRKAEKTVKKIKPVLLCRHGNFLVEHFGCYGESFGSSVEVSSKQYVVPQDRIVAASEVYETLKSLAKLDAEEEKESEFEQDRRMFAEEFEDESLVEPVDEKASTETDSPQADACQAEDNAKI